MTQSADPNLTSPVAKALHPRPQLTREGWTDLSGRWDFAFDDDDQGLLGGWYAGAGPFDRHIQVPFAPESEASGLRETGYHPVLWYRRRVELTPEQRGGKLLLHFGAVDYEAQVWVNGQFVARHVGGHTPFTADVTAQARASDTLDIVVRAEDDPEDLAQPRGKQYWEERPAYIWYHRTSGIWQPVWLERVPETYVTALRWTPDLDHAKVGFALTLSGKPKGVLSARVKLSVQGVVLSDDVYRVDAQETRRDIGLSRQTLARWGGALRWSPEHPNLIRAEIELLGADGGVLDTVGSYFGYRSVGVQGGRFLLNNQPYYLRLVLAQNYWPESHLSAPSEEALRREVELVKALGFNGVRIHQKVEDPRFLYWCDVLGLLVWGEMANAYVFSEDAAERLTREWLDVLRRDVNHPCIVAWVPLNESWGVPNLEGDPQQRHFVKSLYHLTKTLDPTRLAIGNDGWEHVTGDILGIHDYAFDGATLRGRYGSQEALVQTLRAVQPHYRNIFAGGHARAQEPVMLTEFGGLSMRPADDEHWFGYATATSAEELTEKYAELLEAVLDSPVIAGFCYTQLTDTEQETNGLLRADRTPKLDVNKVRYITSRPSASSPGDALHEVHREAEARRKERARSSSPQGEEDLAP